MIASRPLTLRINNFRVSIDEREALETLISVRDCHMGGHFFGDSSLSGWKRAIEPCLDHITEIGRASCRERV